MKRALITGLALAFLVVAPTGWAADARIKGTVSDSSGAPINKAVITLQDVTGGYNVKLKTNKKGQFFRRGLSPRKYNLICEKEGYVSHSIEEVVVQAGVQREFSITLKTPEDRKQEARVERGGAEYAAGIEAYEAGDHEAVVAALTKTVIEKPGDLATRLMLAESLYALDRHAEAVAQYGAALDIDPSRGDVQQRLGQSLLKSGGDEAEAMAAFAKAEELSSDPAVSYNVGALLLKEGRTDEAQAAFERSLAKDPKFPPALNGLGRVFLERQRYADAKTKLEAYLAAQPDASDGAEVKILLRELERLIAKQAG